MTVMEDGSEEADNESLDPSDYGGHAKQYMNALQRLASGGGYVCAQYYHHSELLIGSVAPNSPLTLPPRRMEFVSAYSGAGSCEAYEHQDSSIRATTQ